MHYHDCRVTHESILLPFSWILSLLFLLIQYVDYTTKYYASFWNLQNCS